VQESFIKPEEYHDVNVKGTENIFTQAKEYGIKVVYASSSSVYGNPIELPIKEDSSMNPINPYAQTKVDKEKLAKKYAENGLKVIGMRYFNIFGERQSKEYAGVVKLFLECNKPLENSKILILGISYKPNVKDIQLSPAKIIIEKFQNLGVEIYVYDPFFTSTNVFDLKVEDNLENILPKMDGVVIVTGHDDFKKIEISSFTKMKNPILIDTRGIIDPISAKKEKIIFRGLGRGNF